MNINFELYRIFYIVAKNKNITKAAEELNISQPAISKSIKNLEEQLGGQLFIRTKRGVVLTNEGQEFYKYIKQAVDCISNAENQFTDLINLEVGCIRIGINSTLTKKFLMPYLEEFHNKYPNIDIKIITNITSELLINLRNGLIDVVVLNLVNKKSINDIEFIKCKQIHDCFIINKNLLNLINLNLSISDLNNYPLILPAKGSNTRQFIDSFSQKNNCILKPNMELSSYSLIVEFTKIGFGIGYATREYIKEELKNNELYELKIKEKIPSRYIGIALPKNQILNFSTKKLIEIITREN